MNIIDKIIDSRVTCDQSINRADNPLFSLQDFRSWPDPMISSSNNLFPANMFPITPSQLSRSLKISSSNNGLNLMSELGNNDGDGEKNSDEEEFCEKCQKKFCNKYYLKKHRIEVHKTEFETENSLENFQQKSALFRPSFFNPLFSSPFSNFLLQKSMTPMFTNILLPPTPLSQSTQVITDFNNSSASILAQSGFLSSQSGPGANSYPQLSSSENDIKIPNLATSIFNEVRNSFIKLPTDGKPFLNMNMIDNGFKNMLKTITCTICGIQSTGGESAFLDHLYNCHNNNEKSSNHSPNSKIHLKKESPESSVTNGESYISPFDAFKSSMAAAKLADRVTCDICHKDLCNKYFLRTHKLKLHGIQTMDNNGRTGNRKEKNTYYEHCPPQFDQLNATTNFLPAPFLRTSLPDPVLAASIYQNSTRQTPLTTDNGCLCPICKRLVSLPYFLPLHMWNVHGIGIGGPNSFLPNVSTTRSNIDVPSLDHSFPPIGIQSKINQTLFPLPFVTNGLDSGSMGSKWYRKSPNQMRVRCDICDKWICNKYFLRTHKLNKHGLTDSGSNTDVNSDSVSHGFFVDSSNSVNVNIDSIVSVNNNNSNYVNRCDSSPIDLSATPVRENVDSKSLIPSNKNMLSTFSCSSLLSNLNLRSVLNTGFGMNWPLRLSLDRVKNSSLLLNNANTTAPLDLSVKSHSDIKCVVNCQDLNLQHSLIISAAKRLKIKYQKIHRSRLCRRTSSVLRRHLSFPNQSPCFSCPLCGKELLNAPRFLQHLTIFHDMVLPGNHSGRVAPSNKA